MLLSVHDESWLFYLLILSNVNVVIQGLKFTKVVPPTGKDKPLPLSLDRNEYFRKDYTKSLRKLKKNKQGFNYEDRMASININGPDTLPGDSKDVCLTVGCVESASNILKNLDLTVNPCDDFYEFACGSWIDRSVIPPNSNHRNIFQDITDEHTHHINKLLSTPFNRKSSRAEILAKTFYYSCSNIPMMDKLQYEPYIKMMEKLHVKMPLFYKYTDHSEIDPERITEVFLENFMADTPLFGIDISPDFKAAKDRNLLYLYQPELPFPKSLYVEKNKQTISIMKYYKDYMITSATLFRNYWFSSRFQYTDDKEINIQISNMLALETEIAKTRQINEKIEEEMNKMTFQEFTELYNYKATTKINVPYVVRSVMKKITGIEIKNDTVLIIPQPKYFENLSKILNQTPRNVITNYLTFKHYLKNLPLLGRDARQLSFEFNSIFNEAAYPPPRSTECVYATTKYFGAIISELYMKENNGLKIKEKTDQMIKLIVDSFKTMLREATWMDKVTFGKANEKLEAIERLDIWPYNAMNKSLIEEVFSDSPSIFHEYYLFNNWQMDKWITKITLIKLKSKPSSMYRIDSDFDTTLVNAMYMPNYNRIWIPLGIQYPPFYQLKRTESMNFGGIGSVIGHEFTHGFDDFGSKFDLDGNFKNWWTKKTYANFKERNQCFVEQYGNFSYPELKNIPGFSGSYNVDGNLTLGENIADNGGIRQAYRAFKTYEKKHGKEPRLPGLGGLDSDQLFFVSFASLWCETYTFESLISQLQSNPHPPNKVRVTATLRNMPEFEKAFGCKANDNMVGKRRCKVW